MTKMEKLYLREALDDLYTIFDTYKDDIANIPDKLNGMDCYKLFRNCRVVLEFLVKEKK